MLIYYIIIPVAIFSIGVVVCYFSNKKEEWFKSLKEGDEVSVRIHSRYCDCERDAIVKNEMDEKEYVEAELSEKTLNECKECANINSVDENGISCWYHVTKFDIHDISKKEK